MSLFKNLKIVKTEGHSGIPENELADSLARRAIS
jgi:ribonuclease HI